MEVKIGAANLISYVLLIAIVLSAITIVLKVAQPSLENSKDAAEFERAKEKLDAIDQKIRRVASYGPDTTEKASIEVKRGKYQLKRSNNSLNYWIETKYELVSPGTEKEFGNLVISGEKMTNEAYIVHIRLSYENINLTGMERSLGPGYHSLSINNEGLTNGQTNIEVNVE
ncbi:MAG: hypothetical protein MUP58_01855 [Candidatus Nanohaloarchaeota archaeon QJJ-9]|nr:hypothetical protein [Candidatus Nanohaloarchaeota archaeon QJJ-9]